VRANNFVSNADEDNTDTPVACAADSHKHCGSNNDMNSRSRCGLRCLPRAVASVFVCVLVDVCLIASHTHIAVDNGADVCLLRRRMCSNTTRTVRTHPDRTASTRANCLCVCTTVCETSVCVHMRRHCCNNAFTDKHT
jgi:hypothetical protein